METPSNFLPIDRDPIEGLRHLVASRAKTSPYVTRDRVTITWTDRSGQTIAYPALVVTSAALGMDLLADSASLTHLSLPQEILVRVTAPEGDSELVCVVVAITERDGEQSVLSCRIVSRITKDGGDAERRRGIRWNVSEEFQPSGVATNPTLSNDFIFFRVVDVSSSGLKILTSARNKFLGKGARLDAILSFPLIGRVSATLLVRNVRLTSLRDKDYLSIGVEFERVNERDRAIIGQYLLQFSELESSEKLRQAGLLPRRARRNIEWTFVNDEKSYREALNLRHLAYGNEAKVAAGTRVEHVADVFDARSRILLCRSQGRAVATARLFFPELGDRTEHEEYVSWPSTFPRREETVEVTRTCTHPDYRRGEIFFSLLRFIVVTAAQAQRDWVVTSATNDLVPFYDWVGLKATEFGFNHPTLGGLPHRLLLGSISEAMVGNSVGATAWHLVWREALPFIDSRLLGEGGTLQAIRLFSYKLFGSWGAFAIRLLGRR